MSYVVRADMSFKKRVALNTVTKSTTYKTSFLLRYNTSIITE